MAAVYVHLSGRDVDHALMKMHGLETPKDQKEESELKTKTCSRCQEINAAINKFCQRCGMILDKQESMHMLQQESEQRQANDTLDQLLEDVEFKELFVKKLCEMQRTK